MIWVCRGCGAEGEAEQPPVNCPHCGGWQSPEPKPEPEDEP